MMGSQLQHHGQAVPLSVALRDGDKWYAGPSTGDKGEKVHPHHKCQHLVTGCNTDAITWNDMDARAPAGSAHARGYYGFFLKKKKIDTNNSRQVV
jgi:hypothetical protein